MKLNNSIINLFPRIEYKLSSSYTDDPEDYIKEINGKVSILTDDYKQKTAARCRYFFINLEDSSYPPYYILDILGELEPFVDLYDNETSFFCEKLLKNFKHELWHSNLLIIDRLEILPKYRGRGLGKTMIEDAIKLFSNKADIVALKAFPLQLEVESNDMSTWQRLMKFDRLEQDSKKAIKQLRQFYKSLGFKQFESSMLMIKRT